MRRLILFLFISIYSCTFFEDTKRPNIIIIMTDDQGYGDLGIYNNLDIMTPNIDQFAKNSIKFNNFYVSPVCAPTRSSLMTGRYSLRTGVRDTYNGGAIMSSNEITIAEILKEVNYETGIFGKWHLGDNYPFRPSDQGFDESLIHLAGGIGQVGDITNYYAKDSSYFNPILWHNNKQNKYDGYCSDIFTDNAIRFIEKNKSNPFFCFLSFNAPHTPLQLPEKYYNLYKNADIQTNVRVSNAELKLSDQDIEDAKKVYGMITNIDDNLGKLFSKLKELKIDKETVVIFMTDNGPQQLRYNAKMKGRKGTVYNGGIRVPFFINIPGSFSNKEEIDNLSAHIDILPTIAELSGAELPKKRKIDGKSLIPFIEGKDLNDRFLFSYWTRRFPEKYINMSIHSNQYKLVGNNDFDSDIKDFELYDLKKDPDESKNIINDNISIGLELKNKMDQYHSELINSKNLKNPPRIIIGSNHENPIFLNRNDASGERGIWAQNNIYSYWKVKFNKGTYDFKFKFKNCIDNPGTMFTEINNVVYSKKYDSIVNDIVVMKKIKIEENNTDFISFFRSGNQKIYPFWVEINKNEE